MNDDAARGAEDEPKFEADEPPTHPSAPAPEELAMQTWLASESRAIGPRRSATSRFRAIAVAAVEGGVARVSHVDVLEANAQAALAEPPPTVQTSDAPAPAPSVDESPPERPDVGPRGTVRIPVRSSDRGPTGTVRMKGFSPPPRPDGEGEDVTARRSARIRVAVVAGFALLCVFDIAWISIRAAASPAPAAPVPTTMLSVEKPAASSPPVQPVDLSPSPTSSSMGAAPPADGSPTAAALPSQRPPPAKHAHKRGTNPASVF